MLEEGQRTHAQARAQQTWILISQHRFPWGIEFNGLLFSTEGEQQYVDVLA